MMGGGSATFGSFDEFLGQRNPFAGLGRNTTGGGGAGISSAMINNMINIGGNWTNTGFGFENLDHISLGYDGSYTSLNTALDDYINIPEVVLSGSSFFWGMQAQNGFNSYMGGWNSRSDFAWSQATCGYCNDKGGLQNVNILAIPFMLVEAGITEGLMQGGMEGNNAHSTAQIATFLYAMKVPQGISGEMGIIGKKGGIRIDPNNLKAEVTQDMTQILAGRGTPIIRNGVQAVTEIRSGINPKWVNALEWKIRDYPGTMIDGTRIIQHPSGKWGLVINHDYTKIIQIPTSSAIKWK